MPIYFILIGYKIEDKNILIQNKDSQKKNLEYVILERKKKRIWNITTVDVYG